MSRTMRALTFSTATSKVALEHDRPVPAPRAGEVFIRVLRAGVCSTDLEICRGYVPGFCGVLGHEFVGVVEGYGPPLPSPPPIPQQASSSAGEGRDGGKGVGRVGGGEESGAPPAEPSLAAEPLAIGTRVVGEINCNDAHFTCADAVFQRNHAPGRSVLGIINRDGALAEYVTLPAANLHVVPPSLTDAEAAFAEPLAAACRIPEQGLPRRPESDRVAVIGDGKLGLLVAQVLIRHVAAVGGPQVTLVGRHPDKMALVQGEADRVVSEGDGSAVAERLAGQFDLVVEASGSHAGIRTALALCKPLGTILLKSTVSTTSGGPQPSVQQPEDGCTTGTASSGGSAAAVTTWAEVANDIVVNEKILVGSRCGPFDVALELMARDAGVRQLLRSMISAELPLERGEEALERARTKGMLKVQVVMA